MKTGPSDQTYIQLNVWQTRLTRQATYTTAAQKYIEIGTRISWEHNAVASHHGDNTQANQ